MHTQNGAFYFKPLFGMILVLLIEKYHKLKLYYHERFIVHHCRYPDYWLGIRRILLFSNRVDSRFAGDRYYCIAFRHHQASLRNEIFLKNQHSHFISGFFCGYIIKTQICHC